MTTESNPVLVAVQGGVGQITLNRPHKFNCLSPAVHEGMLAALAQFEADAAVRAVVIDAAGDHFCTGADLDAVQAKRAVGGADLGDFMAVGYRALEALEASPLPVVMAVHGLCLAGGLELMLAADVVIAAGNARFGDQHAQFGLVPGWGGSQRLPRLIGQRRAFDLFFTAKRIDAATALAWGLVNEVCEKEQLRERAIAYGQALAKRSRHGLATMKRLAREGAELTLAEGLQLERKLAAQALMHPDVSEGLEAFQARREPRFP